MSLALRTLSPKHTAAPFLQPKHAPVLSFRRRRSGPGPYANQIFHTGADDNLRHLTAQFGATVAHTFGYGSGVFPQAGYGAAAVPKPQIDMVHIVADPTAFHRANSARFPAHYSALLSLGVGAVAWVQRLGAGVYFNPYVAMAGLSGEKSMVKYGVVSQQTALDDITQWTTMYVAGRLHKPVKHFGCSPDLEKSTVSDSADSPASFSARLLQANNYNLASAFNLSLLLLPRKKRHTAFAEDALYEKIASLSYMGDPRMLVGGENPNKVKNIVSKQASRFASLYEPYLAQALRNGLLQRAPDGSLEKTMDVEAAAALIADLPLCFRRRVLSSYRNKFASTLKDDRAASDFLAGQTDTVPVGPFLLAVAGDSFLRATLKASVSATIAYPALVQSVKGIFTAGIAKSAKYAWEKKMKSRQSKK
ncbi:putative phosphatidate cytidylyltransferase [Clavispora lusitaniae]|uniref:Phosphatidate cytidylyltransferase, mitochondrial n=1 Tax=Clavispora lusitaniae TaxID=36911 RepID=A0AA91T4T9_CLALS|nr:putative phosphatidate cytidylyltransferase [Clavispora lusitaniae]